MRTLAVSAVVWLGLLPAAASATTVSVQLGQGTGEGGSIFGSHLVVEAAPNETNRVTVVLRSFQEAFVADTGAPLIAGMGCTQSSPSEAVCRDISNGWGELTVELLDGDDATAVLFEQAVPEIWKGAVLSGGPGADHIRFDAVAEADLRGGAGDDALQGGSLTTLEGGPGDDKLDGRSAASASYADATTSVRVDLSDRAPDGRTGEADTLTAIRDLTGGSGDDRLVGDGRDNFIAGGGGNDVVSGLGGKDILLGGSGGFGRGRDAGGDDVLRGGPGDDTLHGARGADRLFGGGGRDILIGAEGRWTRFDFDPGAAPDSLHCGTGLDVIRGAEPNDGLERDCELYDARNYGSGTTHWDPWPIPARLRRSGPRALRLLVPCGRGDRGPCRGSVELRSTTAPRRLLGQRRFRMAHGQTENVLIPLGLLGERLLRRGALVRVSVLRVQRNTAQGQDLRYPAVFTTRLPR